MTSHVQFDIRGKTKSPLLLIKDMYRKDRSIS